MSRPVDPGTAGSAGEAPYDRFLLGVDGCTDAEIRFHESGQWRSVTLGALCRRVERLAAALAGYGLGPGRRLAVVASSAIDGWTAELSAMACGAVCVPVDPDGPREALVRILGESAAVVALASTPEALARVQDLRAELGELELVLFFARGASDSAVPATTVETVCGWGAEALERDPEALPRARSETSAGSPAVALYTEEAAAPVVLSQSNVLAAADAIAAAMSLDPSHSVLLAAPYFDPGCRPWVWGALSRRAGLNLGGGGAPTIEDCGATSPTLCVSRRQVFGDLREGLLDRVGRSGIAAALGGRALRAGAESAEQGLSGAKVHYARGWKMVLAEVTTLGRLRRETGGKLRSFVAIDGTLPDDIARFFIAAGMPVLEGLAPAEASGALAFNTPEAFRPGTYGRAVPGLEIRVGEGATLEIRGPGVVGRSADSWGAIGLHARLDGAGFLVPI